MPNVLFGPTVLVGFANHLTIRITVLLAYVQCIAPATRLSNLLPSVVASELEQVAGDAIRTAFPPTTTGFTGLIQRFLANREQLFKGPYVSVALPFEQGSGRNWFLQIPLPISPSGTRIRVVYGSAIIKLLW